MKRDGMKGCCWPTLTSSDFLRIRDGVPLFRSGPTLLALDSPCGYSQTLLVAGLN